MRTSKSKLNFKKFTSLKLEDFAEGIKAGIWGNLLVFLTIPMTLVAFLALITEYSDARKAYEQGGTAQLPLYQKTMKALKAALIILAPYVDSIALGDIPTIKMAGFEATFDPSQLGKSSGSKVESLTLEVENKATQELVSDCETFKEGTIIVGILSEGAPVPDAVKVDTVGAVTIPANTPNKIIVHTGKNRKKVYKNLTSGLYYYCTYFVIIKGVVSAMSVQVKKMCQ